MKKIIVILFALILFTTGCSNDKKLEEDAKIYTTIYPTKYIVENLYDATDIESIYPNGVNLKEYTLSEKQMDNYSKGDLFVYVGLGSEKEIAKSFLNRNDNLLIIDATYGLNYNNGLEELWLAPNNFLMLVKNIRNSLIEYLDNSVKEDEIEKNYQVLYENISKMDAELREIGTDALNDENNTIVVSSNVFKFLESYNFEVISLEEIINSKSDTALNNIKNKFKLSKYTKILTLSGEENTELLEELVSKYNASKIELNNLVTNEDTANDYITIEYENISKIRDYING